MKKNKKGFTLVELLAVVIVLIIIIIIAINAVRKNVDKTLDNAIIANAGMYVKAVNEFVQVESIGNADLKNGFFTTSQLESYGVKVSGTKPTSGKVVVSDRKVSNACLKYDEYYVTYKDGKVSSPTKNECSISVDMEFDYAPEEQQYNVLASGQYKIEVWGGSQTDKGASPSYGSYAVANVSLNIGDTVVIRTAPGLTWTKCGNGEGGTCTFSGKTTVCYGAGTRWACQEATNSIECGNATFGDPAFGDIKACYYLDGDSPISTVGLLDEFDNVNTLISVSNSTYDISNSNLTSKHITCYGCTASSTPYEIRNTSCYDAEAKAECSKSGKGYVKITFLSNIDDHLSFNSKFSNYNELSYIESNGSQYIDTGYKPKANTQIDATFMYSSLSYQQRLFGNDSGTNNTSTTNPLSYSFYINGAGKFAYAYNNGGGNWVATTVNADTNMHSLHFNKKGNVTIDNVYSESISGTASNVSSYNLYILSNNDLGTIRQDPPVNSSAKLYSFKISEGDNVIHNYLPCSSKSNSTDVGLCDLVTGEFKGSSSSTPFIAGPVL